MSWQRAHAALTCQGLDGAEPCAASIPAGTPYRTLANGRVTWCQACAARKLGERPPDDLPEVAPPDGRVVLPQSWLRFGPQHVDGAMRRAEPDTEA